MNKNEIDLEKGKIGKLLFRLSLPIIVAQIVNVLYNIVDRIFIGRLPDGEVAMAGVGIAFPIIIIISAFSSLIGAGGAPIASIKMGEKDNDGAEKILSNSFAMLIIIGIVLTIIFAVFQEKLLWAFGASETSIVFAKEYLSIYLIGTVFVQIALGMNPFINAQGFTKVGMTTVLIGAFTNIVLDPIFIFVFDMGVSGAALATIIAQFASALWALKFLFGKQSILKIRKKYLKPDIKVVLSIMALGIAPFIMQSTESLVLISLNNQLMRYSGDLAVGAMTIMSSVLQMVLLPINGLTQGAQPIISYNFGARQIDRVKKTFKLLFICSMAYTIFMWGALNIYPEGFVRIFNNKPEVIEMTSWSIKIFFGGIFLFGAQMACQQTLLALGQAKISLLLALLRKVILLIPLIYIIPSIMDDKLKAVLLAEPISDILAAITTMICFGIFYKKTLSKIEKEDNKKVQVSQ